MSKRSADISAEALQQQSQESATDDTDSGSGHSGSGGYKAAQRNSQSVANAPWPAAAAAAASAARAFGASPDASSSDSDDASSVNESHVDDDSLASSSASEEGDDELRRRARDVHRMYMGAWDILWGHGDEQRSLRQVSFTHGPKFARRVAALGARTSFPTAEGALALAYYKVLEDSGIPLPDDGLSQGPRKLLAYRRAADAHAAAFQARVAFIAAFFPRTYKQTAVSKHTPPDMCKRGQGGLGCWVSRTPAAAKRSSKRLPSQREGESVWAFYLWRKQKHEQKVQAFQERLKELRPRLAAALIAVDAKHAEATKRLSGRLEDQTYRQQRHAADPLDKCKAEYYCEATARAYRTRRRLQHLEWRRASLRDCIDEPPADQQRS